MTRQQSAGTLAAAMSAARVTYYAIRAMLIDSLAPYQRTAWDYAVQRDGVLTTSETAIALNVSQNQASNVLKELSDFGLLSRTRLENSGAFIYRVRH